MPEATANPKPPSVLLVFAAAYSTIGWSVSILAWLWLSVLPHPAKPVEPILIDKKARRRSAPAALQSHPRRSPSPPKSPDQASLITIPPRKRRVYFVDSPQNPSRPSSRQQPTGNDSSELLDKPLHASPTAESPASSSSTLVHTYPALPPQTLETCRESAVESDSSSSSSPRRSLTLTRPFQRPRRSSGSDAPSSSPLTLEGKQPRRSSGNFIPQWPAFRRSSASKSQSTPISGTLSSSSPATAVAPSYFTRKHTRRVSTPVPRTQPYAYPYFAEPPKLDDQDYIAYLRGGARTPPIPDSPVVEVLPRSWTAPESDDGAAYSKARTRKLNDKAQAALGVGRRPSGSPRKSPQQRSASEGWVDRP